GADGDAFDEYVLAPTEADAVVGRAHDRDALHGREAAALESDGLRSGSPVPVHVDHARATDRDALKIAAGEEGMREVDRLDVRIGLERELLVRREILVVGAGEQDGSRGEIDRHAAPQEQRA